MRIDPLMKSNPFEEFAVYDYVHNLTPFDEVAFHDYVR